MLELWSNNPNNNNNNYNNVTSSKARGNHLTHTDVQIISFASKKKKIIQ
jgi:hypothetical protein